MRMHSVTSTIENGFVHIPDKAEWLHEYLHELATFPKGKYDDQADSTSQALDWFKQACMTPVLGVVEWLKQEAEKPGNQWPAASFTRRDILCKMDASRSFYSGGFRRF